MILMLNQKGINKTKSGHFNIFNGDDCAFQSDNGVGFLEMTIMIFSE